MQGINQTDSGTKTLSKPAPPVETARGISSPYDHHGLSPETHHIASGSTATASFTIAMSGGLNLRKTGSLLSVGEAPRSPSPQTQRNAFSSRGTAEMSASGKPLLSTILERYGSTDSGGVEDAPEVIVLIAELRRRVATRRADETEHDAIADWFKSKFTTHPVMPDSLTAFAKETDAATAALSAQASLDAVMLASEAGTETENKPSFWQKLYNLLPNKPTLGETLTFTAMIPQAVFAALLVYIKGKPELEEWFGGKENAAAAVAGTLAIAAAGGVQLGKYMLVEFWGHRSWEEIYAGKPIVDITGKGPKGTAFAMAKMVGIFTAAGTFGLLGYVAMADPKDGLGQLIRSNFGNEGVASLFETPIVWGPMALASIICNIPAFKNIINFGLGNLKGMANNALARPSDQKTHLTEKAKHDHGINMITRELNELVKELRNPQPVSHKERIKFHLNNILEKLEFVLGKPKAFDYQLKSPKEKILHLLEKDRTGIDFTTRFKLLAMEDTEFKPTTGSSKGCRPLSRLAPIAKDYLPTLAGAGCVAVASAGLTNFIDFGNQLGSLLTRSEIGASITGGIEMAMMILMATFTAEFGVAIANYFLGIESRDKPDLLSKRWNTRIHIEAFLICVVIGGLANLFQSIIAGQDAGLMICAVLASAALELFGWYGKRHQMLQAHIAKTNALGKELTPVVIKLTEFIQSFEYSSVEHPGPTMVMSGWESIKACIKPHASSESSRTSHHSEENGLEQPLLSAARAGAGAGAGAEAFAGAGAGAPRSPGAFFDELMAEHESRNPFKGIPGSLNPA